MRPSWKERYPLVSIERYAGWRRADGLLFDPWMRVHERLVGMALFEQVAVNRQCDRKIGAWPYREMMNLHILRRMGLGSIGPASSAGSRWITFGAFGPWPLLR